VTGAELWIVGRPRMDIGPLRAAAGPGVRFVPRFVGDAELAAFFRRADVVVLPYAQTERLDFSGVLATALAFGRATVLSDVGGFSEVAAHGAARLVPPGTPRRCGQSSSRSSGRRGPRAPWRGRPRRRRGPYSWDAAPKRRWLCISAWSERRVRALKPELPAVQAGAGAAVRRATSARTTGATSVPNSSIERRTSACLTAPTLI